jgi:hypothetical protein
MGTNRFDQGIVRRSGESLKQFISAEEIEAVRSDPRFESFEHLVHTLIERTAKPDHNYSVPVLRLILRYQTQKCGLSPFERELVYNRLHRQFEKNNQKECLFTLEALRSFDMQGYLQNIVVEFSKKIQGAYDKHRARSDLSPLRERPSKFIQTVSCTQYYRPTVDASCAWLELALQNLPKSLRWAGLRSKIEGCTRELDIELARHQLVALRFCTPRGIARFFLKPPSAFEDVITEPGLREFFTSDTMKLFESLWQELSAAQRLLGNISFHFLPLVEMRASRSFEKEKGQEAVG